MREPAGHAPCAACGTRNIGNAARCVGCGSALRREQPRPIDLHGEEVGGHRLGELLGRGSMGSVYSVEHPLSDVDGCGLAMKILHPHIAADASRVKRFRREAKAALALNHPSIVQLHEFGHDETHGPYILMERLDGQNLVERTRNGPRLGVNEVITVFDQILSALMHAHEHGIVHRDLKAENIVLHEAGDEVVAKVCDFGMVKLLHDEGTAITEEGLVCGTPEYMSPEQARGEELDARADIYAVGCLLFLVLTGRLPFRGASAVDTLGQQLVRPVPSARGTCPDLEISPALDEVAQVAMAKAPSARFQSAGKMRAAILRGDDPLEAQQHGGQSARWFVQMLLFCVLIGLGLWALARL